MEMSTISKTNPNTNQSSKTNDGLNPLPDLPPISTLTPPVTIYGVSPQLYIGQNGASRATFAYTTSTLTITTQDNSSFVLDANNAIFNKPLKIYTGVAVPEIQLGASVFNQSVISQQNYGSFGDGLSLLSPTLSELIIRDDKVLVNRDFEVLKVMAGGSIILNLQNNDGSRPDERKAVFKYTEVGGLDAESAQLEISVPPNTGIFPTTPGSSLHLLQNQADITHGNGALSVFDDTIVLSATTVQLQNTPLNASSYLYLNSFKDLSNTQPAPVTWTPEITFTTPGGSTKTYITQYGLCWKYGNTSYVVFGIDVDFNITIATNLLITGNLTYPATTQLTDLKFNNQSSVSNTTRFVMSSWSQIGQTTPAWLVGLLNMSALNGFVFNQTWVTGTGPFNVKMYGEGFLCHG